VANRSKNARRASLAAVVSISLALTACAGLPTTSDVSVGEQINDNVQIDLGFAPQGPVTDAQPAEIMQDFILAATNPQNDFAIARLFLTQDFSHQWDPNEIVIIRSGVAATTEISETSLSYSFTTSASVDAAGRYFQVAETETATRTFTFVQEAGQWRISEAPPGIVLSEDSFGKVFTQRALYFFDPTFQFLVPDLRWYPNRAGINIRVVSSLLTGPASWLGQGVVISEFPEGTGLGDGLVEVDSGVATVDLTEQAREATRTQRERMRQQLAASLGSVASVVVTIAGIPLDIPQAGGGGAVTNPAVEPLLLVRRDNEFGYIANDEVSSIPQLSAQILSVDAVAATIDRGKSAAAVLGASGVYAIRAGASAPELVDSRPGLIAPSIDTSGFIWSVPRTSGAAIRTFEFDGTDHEVVSELPGSSRVVSMDVSRDGTRLLMYLSTPNGPQLIVAGIIRQELVPVALGELLRLPLDRGTPIDAAWIDDRTIATVADREGRSVVTAHQIGGPRMALGALTDSVAIVGGNGGTDGIRVSDSEGQIFRSRGTTWQRTGVIASFIATQQ
jgi:hypothetical protein